eukprot:CAMPEP_0167784388 /NCGR_PEP_ID=MMETSP0111_2-20121227/7610_1 /TAXON_ID=91324 /ORGANISM="Lotharella globosa, Strain CCCM811" /LENGTH=216 /DNA_ID=CAMNT_0007675455 /DNA_START=118 /DNA_END=765 /DNA_ORIENTATION=-
MDQLKIPGKQKDELVMMESIYMDDFNQVKPFFWERDGVVHYWIALKPSLDSQQHVAVRMDVRLSKGYPKTDTPDISFQDLKGFEGVLTSIDMKDLNAKTKQIIKSSKAADETELAVHEVIAMVNEFLSKRNQERISVHEEMLIREKQRQEDEEAARQKERETKAIAEKEATKNLIKQIHEERARLSRASATLSDEDPWAPSPSNDAEKIKEKDKEK